MNQNRYRIFLTPDELSALDVDLDVQESYPAFTVALVADKAIAAIRTRFPVEELPPPKPPPPLAQVASAASALGGPARGPYTRVARFEAPVRQEWCDAITAAECRVLDFIGSSTVVVMAPNKPALARLHALPHVARITDYRPDIQVAPEFLVDLTVDDADEGQRDERSSAVAPGLLIATFFTPDDQQLAKRSFHRQGIGDIVEAGDTALVINLQGAQNPLADIQTIITRPGLRGLEEKPLQLSHNNVARAIIAGAVVDGSANGVELTGKGEIIAVADTGLDTGDASTIHPDFRGRIKDIRSFPIAPSWAPLVDNPNGDDGPSDKYSGHGTHVSGSALGNGVRAVEHGLDPIRGIAPEAELIFQAIEQTAQWTAGHRFRHLMRTGRPLAPNALLGIPDDLQDLLQAAYDQGARIHSNSWGGGVAGAYSIQCNQLDRFVWHHRDCLVLVAAGNDGVDSNGDVAGIDPMSVSSPATAKNCLTVGACENPRVGEFLDKFGAWWPEQFGREPFRSDAMTDSADDIVAFSSRGPCSTGRRKPDVIAPGTFILSTRSSQIAANNFAWRAFPIGKRDYMFMGGTSMATPLVAGCAALVRQYLRTVVGIETPSAALLKAALIHCAQYHTYRYAQPDSSPWSDNEQGWGRVELRHALAPEAPTNVHFIDAADGIPANDMQCYTFNLTDGSTALRATLAYSDFPGVDLINNLNLVLFAPDGTYYVGNDFDNSGAPDSDNNVEGVIVLEPQVGTWTVRVIASNIPEGPQDFALVLSGGGLTVD